MTELTRMTCEWPGVARAGHERNIPPRQKQPCEMRGPVVRGPDERGTFRGADPEHITGGCRHTPLWAQLPTRRPPCKDIAAQRWLKGGATSSTLAQLWGSVGVDYSISCTWHPPRLVNYPSPHSVENCKVLPTVIKYFWVRLCDLEDIWSITGLCSGTLILPVSHTNYVGLPQQTRDIEPSLVQCWTSIVDGGPTLNQQWLNI